MLRYQVTQHSLEYTNNPFTTKYFFYFKNINRNIAIK